MSSKTTTPVIGITPHFDNGVKLPKAGRSMILRREYTEAIAAVGGTPLVLNPSMSVEIVLSLCDGLVLSGGEDVPAHLYGATQTLYLEEPLERVEWETKLIRAFRHAKKPILGVCYGMQLLAVVNGGALHQDIDTEIPDVLVHHNAVTNASMKHMVTFSDDFLGFTAGQQVEVASRHHQAVALVPGEFHVAAKAPDGVIEAIRGDRVYGIQWHPESDETAMRIYRSFVKLCE